MSDILVSGLGQVNSSGDRKALFQKIFTTEVLATFDADNPFMDLHRVRTISSGKSADFPFLGNIGATYHIPGAELAGGKINHANTVISVDNLLIAQASIANIEEAMNHYDVRQPYSTELGRALKREFASKLARLFCRAARSVGPLASTWYPNRGSSGALTSSTAYGINGQPAPPGAAGAKDTDLVKTNGATAAAELLAGINTALLRLDQKNVPEDGRFIMLAPAQYWLIMGQAGSLNATSSVMNADIGGSGSLSSGTWPTYMGARLIKTNYMPQLQYSRDANGMPTGTQGLITSDSTGNTGGMNYNGDFRTTLAIVGQKEALGTVKLLDLATEMSYEPRLQATLMLAKYAMGHGILRPECVCEIASAAISSAANEVPSS